jgi:uncharacterized membrane protein
MPDRRFTGSSQAAQRGSLRDATDEQMAKALGWLSIGLGVTELLAPRQLGRLIGAGSYSRWLPLLGLREIASGIAILSDRRPTGGVLSRVAGDAIDLAFLAAAANSRGASGTRLAAAAAGVMGVTTLDIVCSERLAERPAAQHEDGEDLSGVRLRHAITINRPAADLYQKWRDFQNLPQWMSHLKSVEPKGENRTHWIAAGPLGTSVGWDAEVTEDQPGEAISWRSLPGSQVDTSGSVSFVAAPGNRGTEVRIEMTYNPPLGQVGAVVASLFGRSAEQEITEDLRRFKRIMETGEVPSTEGQPRGVCL